MSINNKVLQSLNKKLVVSCQPLDGPLNKPQIIAAMAKAAIIGGAGAVRIEGIQNIIETRKLLNNNEIIIGLVKRDLNEYNVRITVYLDDVKELISAGADIIAIDATNRPRPCSIKNLLKLTKDHNKIAMADCSNLEEGIEANKLGFDIIGTTLSGYTTEYTPQEPDFELLKQFHNLNFFVMAEGRYNTPELANQAMKYANSVTVGTALTRLETMTQWFVKAINSTN